MARFHTKLTPRLLMAAVLVIGLLTAGSAALLKGSPQGDAQVDDAVAAAPLHEVAEIDGATSPTDPGADMPRILPMPPREAGGPRNPESAPTSGVRWGQFVALLADTFGETFRLDAAEPDRGLPLGDFSHASPDEPVSRAALAQAVVHALGLTDVARAHAPTEPIFRDVPADHEAFAAVAMMERLGLYPFHVGTLFVPDEHVQWAEVKFTVEAADALDNVRGPVVHINGPARTVSVEWTPRHATAYIAGEGTLIVRNGERVALERLRPGDEVHGIADKDGQLFLVVASGSEAADGMSDELLALVRELATPEQLAAIISRDWERAAVELKGSVYKQLLDRGATPEEAEALLSKDWAVVEERSKARLTELISDTTDVKEDLVRAVLDRDWDAAIGFIEVEVLEYVLNQLVV